MIVSDDSYNTLLNILDCIIDNEPTTSCPKCQLHDLCESKGSSCYFSHLKQTKEKVEEMFFFESWRGL